MSKFLFPILAIIAAGGLVLMYVQPTLANITVLETKELRFEEQLEEAKEVKTTIQNLENTLSNIDQSDLEKLEYILPKEIDIPRIMNNINTLTEALGAEVVAIELIDDKGKKDGPYIQHSINIGFNATYRQFLDILRNIETSLQLSNVTGIQVGVSETNNSSSEVEAPYAVIFTFYEAN